MRLIGWLWLALWGGTCAATCSRSEVRSSDTHEVATLDAGVRVEEERRVEVDRHEVRVQGPVEIVRVEEVLAMHPDGGTPVVTHRTTTTTRREPSRRIVDTSTHAGAHSEVTASLSETLAADSVARSSTEVERDVGPSWRAVVAIIVVLLCGGFLAWRFRGWP